MNVELRLNADVLMVGGEHAFTDVARIEIDTDMGRFTISAARSGGIELRGDDGLVITPTSGNVLDVTGAPANIAHQRAKLAQKRELETV